MNKFVCATSVLGSQIFRQASMESCDMPVTKELRNLLERPINLNELNFKTTGSKKLFKNFSVHVMYQQVQISGSVTKNLFCTKRFCSVTKKYFALYLPECHVVGQKNLILPKKPCSVQDRSCLFFKGIFVQHKNLVGLFTWYIR